MPVRIPNRRQVIKSSKPHPSPEPVHLDDIHIKDIWNTVNNVSSNLVDKLPKVDNSKTSISVQKRWKSQSSLIKPASLSTHLPQRSKSIYISGDKSLHMSMEKMITLAGYNNNNNGSSSKKDDRLPVVELKPFVSSTKKEWIPAKSRAWEDELAPPSQQYVIRSAEYLYQNEYPDPQKLDTPRPTEGVCSKAFPTGAERKSAHPKVKDVAEGTVIQREVSFVPKTEREKTTAEEIRHNSLYNQYPPFSFVSRELTEYDIRRQQTIRVNGLKMDRLPPENNMYMNTWQVYKSASMGQAKPNTNKPQERTEHIENSYLDGSIYDCFDRSVTLPSITVKAAGKNKQWKPVTKDGNDRNNNRPGYRLGVVNSLDIMSMCGKPLRIEQNLTNHLKITLEQLKRTKDPSFMQNNSNNISREKTMFNKMEVTGVPTIGELMIKEARKSNSYAGSQSAPVKRSKSLKSTSDYNLQSRATTYLYDSGFEGSSNDRKSVPCVSPTKSLNRNSRMQMHQVITEDVKMNGEDNNQTQQQQFLLASDSLISQLEQPPATPTTERVEKQDEKQDEISSVGDSVDIEQPSKSGRSDNIDTLNELANDPDQKDQDVISDNNTQETAVNTYDKQQETTLKDDNQLSNRKPDDKMPEEKGNGGEPSLNNNKQKSTSNQDENKQDSSSKADLKENDEEEAMDIANCDVGESSKSNNTSTSSMTINNTTSNDAIKQSESNLNEETGKTTDGGADAAGNKNPSQEKIVDDNIDDNVMAT